MNLKNDAACCMLAISISDMQICELLGIWLKEYRRNHGLTLSRIADAARKYGANWRAANISRMEAGGNSIDALPTLLTLFAALNDLTGDDLKLSTPFANEVQRVEKGAAAPLLSMNGDYDVDTYEIYRSLKDRPVKLSSSASLTVAGNDGKNSVGVIFPDTMMHSQEDGHDTPINRHYPPTSAEKRLANRLIKEQQVLALDDYTVAAICDLLYGHSLDEEAAKRAGEGATPQKRGRVTRVLAGEILNMINACAKLED
ncbi:helix-turn-helix domain-containing protein [Bifidobacterium pseudolongum]|nr:helix-turn-helix transcriptional regulator [Bifidobacterium pseudolongum]